MLFALDFARVEFFKVIYSRKWTRFSDTNITFCFGKILKMSVVYNIIALHDLKNISGYTNIDKESVIKINIS